jgi:SAM-dependent methyltransferase
VCTLSLCTVPDDRAAIAAMWRLLRPGGRLLLLDHIGSRWWPVWAVRRLVDVFTARSGEYQTRRPLPLVEAAGFEITGSQRLKIGTVERVAARKPTSQAGSLGGAGSLAARSSMMPARLRDRRRPARRLPVRVRRGGRRRDVLWRHQHQPARPAGVGISVPQRAHQGVRPSLADLQQQGNRLFGPGFGRLRVIMLIPGAGGR